MTDPTRDILRFCEKCGHELVPLRMVWSGEGRTAGDWVIEYGCETCDGPERKE